MLNPYSRILIGWTNRVMGKAKEISGVMLAKPALIREGLVQQIAGGLQIGSKDGRALVKTMGRLFVQACKPY